MDDAEPELVDLREVDVAELQVTDPGTVELEEAPLDILVDVDDVVLDDLAELVLDEVVVDFDAVEVEGSALDDLALLLVELDVGVTLT